MSIWVDKNTKLIVQGITGKAARIHTEQMLEYSKNIVGGVSPGKSGTTIFDIPVYDTVCEAKENTGANSSIIFVPPNHAANAIIEAIDAKLDLIVCITEHIPVLDMITVKRYMQGKKTRLIGPNCPGIITPDEIKIGIMPSNIHKKGNIGIVSRSGTLTYEAVSAVTKAGFGQSTAVGIGGDPIIGTDFIDVLDAFNKDSSTELVILIGEIGGESEEKAALWIKENMTKPVIGFISGKTAPAGKRMGHAGAIVSGSSGTAQSKIKTMKESGLIMVDKLSDLTIILKDAIKSNETI